MVQGTLYAMSMDCHSVAGKTAEDHVEDLKACVSCDTNSPFIHIDLTAYPALEKYTPIWECFGGVVPAFESSIDSITGMIEKCAEMPDKITALGESAPDELAEMDMMSKAKALASLPKVIKALKACVTGLLDDMNSLKADLLDLKDMCSTMASEIAKGKEYF